MRSRNFMRQTTALVVTPLKNEGIFRRVTVSRRILKR